MADLDDFFAKKDRKKSKSSTKKFPTTTEELVKKIEDTSARTAKSTEVRPPQSGPAAADGNDQSADTVEQAQAPVEDEWLEFEVEERKDYSGLKIGQLQIEDDDEDYDYDNEKSGNKKYDNEVSGENDRTGNEPWKKKDESVAAPAPVAAPVVAPAATSRYVSPGMRDFAPLKAKTRKGILPDIHDQDYFPVLGSAKPEEVKKKKPEPGYEEVRHGGRLQRSAELGSTQPVAIGNRFNSLADS